jgi:hypothetical protein
VPAKKKDRTKVYHRWTKKTLADCAQVHMDQLEFVHLHRAGAVRDRKIAEIIESYYKIHCSVYTGKKYIFEGRIAHKV